MRGLPCGTKGWPSSRARPICRCDRLGYANIGLMSSQPMGPATPADPLLALRLGWYLAECHGRYLSLAHARPLAEEAVKGRGPWFPLGQERSPRERVIEVEKGLCLTASALGLDQSFA